MPIEYPVWAIPANWRAGVTERLEWATGVLQSHTGAEQARSLRIAPRRTLEAELLVDGAARRWLDLALAARGSMPWSLPIWPDVQHLEAPAEEGATIIACDTRWRDFRAGGLAALHAAGPFGWHLVEVEEVTEDAITVGFPLGTTWPAGTALYPVRHARLLQQPTTKRITDTVGSGRAEFLIIEPCDWPAALPAAQYRGHPVLDLPPNESRDLTASYQRLLLELESVTAFPVLTDSAGLAFTVQDYRWLLHGREHHAVHRSLLYALHGRQQVLWVPTFADDLTLHAPVASNATTIDVERCGYAEHALGLPGRRDIRIELANGTVLHRRITDATVMNAESERLTIDSALGVAVSPAAVARISYLALCRLDHDAVEIRHETDVDGVAECQVVFRSIRDDL